MFPWVKRTSTRSSYRRVRCFLWLSGTDIFRLFDSYLNSKIYSFFGKKSKPPRVLVECLRWFDWCPLILTKTSHNKEILTLTVYPPIQKKILFIFSLYYQGVSSPCLVKTFKWTEEKKSEDCFRRKTWIELNYFLIRCKKWLVYSLLKTY